jgi:hypothetical protein
MLLEELVQLINRPLHLNTTPLRPRTTSRRDRQPGNTMTIAQNDVSHPRILPKGQHGEMIDLTPSNLLDTKKTTFTPPASMWIPQVDIRHAISKKSGTRM